MKKTYKRSLLIAVTSALTISGCSSTNPNESSLSAENNYPMNQPRVNEVVVIGGASKTVKELKDIAIQKNGPLNTLSASTLAIDSIPEAIPTVAKELQIITSIDSSKTFDFSLLKGESYKSALYRWLNNLGYTKIGTLLNEEYQIKINERSDRDLIMTTTANKAINYLINAIDKVELTEKQEKTLSLHDFTHNDDEKFHVEFTGNQEVVLTTSQLPMSMFEAKRGDLLTNYLRLGAKYGWNVHKDFYLASNYEIPFDFLVVTEEGNIKSALEQLLTAYPGLTAGIYEPKREIYIESVEQ